MNPLPATISLVGAPAADWKDLTTPSAWQGGVKAPFPSNAWRLEDGALTTTSRLFQSLYSRESYDFFELRFEFKIAPGSNSGVKYLCAPGMMDPDWQAAVQAAPWLIGFLFLFALAAPAVAWWRARRAWLRWTLTACAFLSLLSGLAAAYLHKLAHERIARTPPGFEYQIIDDHNYRVSLRPEQRTGSLYDLLPATPAPEPIAGVWHSGRIVVAPAGVEHWLDGRRVLRYRLPSPELSAAVNGSKFRRVTGFDQQRAGLLQLQAHDGQVWFRNLRVRRLSPQ